MEFLPSSFPGCANRAIFETLLNLSPQEIEQRLEKKII